MQLEPPHPAAIDPQALLGASVVQRVRRSGPGGQHRNKVETAVVITHAPTGVSAEANERRSQHENLSVALFRLRVRLALAVRLPAGSIDLHYPSDLWQSRLHGGRLSISPQHDDFPALLAEALDSLSAHGWDDRAAASKLSVSRSQIIRLLKHEGAALKLLNFRRSELGLGPLR